jgi:hypothetical protein
VYCGDSSRFPNISTISIYKLMSADAPPGKRLS